MQPARSRRGPDPARNLACGNATKNDMAELLLNVKSLHAGYGKAEVLHGLTITARAGKVITVIGPNGAGKSTLLNALMGVLASRGTIEYDGAPIGLRSLEERVMLGMALVPETRALFGTMSVEDNLLLGAYRPVSYTHLTLPTK